MNITPLIKPSALTLNQSATKIYNAPEVPSINWGQDGFLPEIQADMIYPSYPVAATQQVNSTESKAISDEERFSEIIRRYDEKPLNLERYDKMLIELQFAGLITIEQRWDLTILFARKQGIAHSKAMELQGGILDYYSYGHFMENFSLSIGDMFSELMKMLENLDNMPENSIPRYDTHRTFTETLEESREFFVEFFTKATTVLSR